MHISEIIISVPDDLKKAITTVNDLVESGQLIETRKHNETYWDTSKYIDSWPDYFQNFYTDENGKEWVFFAETYHGSGGAFKRNFIESKPNYITLNSLMKKLLIILLIVIIYLIVKA